MSSSFLLKKRYEESDVWTFGHWSDHYLRRWGNCHPDFEGIPIGNPNGMKMCVRKHAQTPSTHNPEKGCSTKFNGRYTHRPNLYKLCPPTTVQLDDPYPSDTRQIPNYEELLYNGYFRKGVQYNGIGVETTAPRSGRDQDYDLALLSTPLPRYNLTEGVQRYPRQLLSRERKGLSNAHFSKVAGSTMIS